MIRRITLFIVLIAATTLLPACSSTPKNADGVNRSPKEISDLYVDLGTSALINDDLPRAIENLRIAIQYDGNNAVAHNHMGLALLNMGKRQDAKEAYLRAISRDEKYSDAYVNLGTWYFYEKDYATAKRYYQKALDNLEYKSRYLPLTSLGHIELVNQNLGEAKRFLFEALALNPEYCLAHMLLGRAHELETRYDKAAAEYKLSIRGLCVRNIEGQYQLAVIYERLKNYAKAKSQYTQIIESFPNTRMAEMASEKIKDIP